MSKFATIAVHGGQVPDPVTGSRAVPIYQTTAYVFNSTEHAAKLFALQEPSNIYTRLQNPTTDVLENRVAQLEGGVGALATASGQSAITLTILNLAKAGDEIVASASLYGGTYNLFSTTLPKMGIKAHLISGLNIADYTECINEKTKALYLEIQGNPKLDTPDLQAFAELAHAHGIPLIVDNTLATPYLCRPLEHGADIVVHSATKFLGGHGNSMGGVIVDGGNFDWEASGRFPDLVDPDPSYHGISYSKDVGKAAFIVKARVQLLRDTGACISPFNSFLILQGIETLHLRMKCHCANALAVANFLKTHPNVEWVNYPGQPDNPAYNVAKKYFTNGFGAMLSFGIKGGLEAGKNLINNLKLFSHVANLGDTRSLVIHPASTTHQQLTPEQQISSGVLPELVRLSIGIEDVEDIIADLNQALRR